MMKKVIVALLLIAAMASPALAGPAVIQAGYSYTADGLFGPYRNPTAGGEFTFNTLDSGFLPTGYKTGVTSDIGVAGTFQTFCIDTLDPILGYNTQYNAVLSPTMDVGGTPNNVSVGSGYLYGLFAMGMLTGYDYSLPGRLASAFALQQTLWWLEGFTINPNNIFSAAAIARFGSIAGAQANGGENFGVYALNLRFLNGAAAQDVLFYVPDGGATLMLLGGALMGLGALRRKFRG